MKRMTDAELCDAVAQIDRLAERIVTEKCPCNMKFNRPKNGCHDCIVRALRSVWGVAFELGRRDALANRGAGRKS